MAEKLTAQQLQAVTDRGGKLLVSAAAGSGKTKVLVDRLMSYLEDPISPANIDDFLIITYTKAAAAELRGKIAAKLSQRIAQEPEKRHLQQQLQRLYLTKISTVHSFCTDLLREYAYRLDIPGNFRVAEENECFELQIRALDQLLEGAYIDISNNTDFQAFVDTQGLGRDDRQIPEIVLKVYNSAMCHLNPDAWLDWCVSVADDRDVADAADTVWGRYLIEDLKQYLDLQITALDRCAQQALACEGMEKPSALIYETVEQLRHLQSGSRWDDIVGRKNIDYGRLSFPKKCADLPLVSQMKAVREACKKGLAKKLRRFSDSSEQIAGDMRQLCAATRGLVALTRNFKVAYDKLKQTRRILDFNDLEQRTLDLLLGMNRTHPTGIAAEIGQRYREVMVDEYQDSNAVQDAIFSAITEKRQNCFMVGDVKQSIYQFRLADPGIFLEKYASYQPADHALPGQGRKVLLSSNFRSAGAVISAVNDVFSTCMSKEVGGLAYGQEESLQEGLPHTPMKEPEIEFFAIDVKEDTYAEEAAFTAERICQLLDGTHTVRDGDGFRPIKPEDIVILLRSPGSMGDIFVQALKGRGIPSNMGVGSNLLQAEEIASLRALLQAIDNPQQDIPLIAAMSSRMFGFTADDLAAIRGGQKSGSFYDALRSSNLPKARMFVETLSDLRCEARMYALPNLLQYIFATTKLDCIFASMPDGKMRTENLQSFCRIASMYDVNGGKCLADFLHHLDAIEERGLAVPGSQGVPNAVTIMSIHKSKGLEFPVVFLCGLSREFNRDSIRAQVLCDNTLGLGLSCVDSVNRVRFPSLAKRAVAAKMTAEGVSEEMRVLYVAMTRPRDRLIMTYADRNLETTLTNTVLRMDLSDPLLMTAEVTCPGEWLLLTALKRQEAGALFDLGGRPMQTHIKDPAWLIRVVSAPDGSTPAEKDLLIPSRLPEATVHRLEKSLAFRYAHIPATQTPSKQTATQLKGREKDREAAEHTPEMTNKKRAWKRPSFVCAAATGEDYGNTMHCLMQHICYEECTSVEGVQGEIKRLVDAGYITAEQSKMVNPNRITEFFTSDLGERLGNAKTVLREFKFSILDDGIKYCQCMEGEQVLLQGVVDCAFFEPDGITVIDFKTDRVSPDTLDEVAGRYRPQITAYGDALARIYGMDIKSKYLYFFSMGKAIPV